MFFLLLIGSPKYQAHAANSTAAAITAQNPRRKLREIRRRAGSSRPTAFGSF
ncbi:MAG: hypothetical protein FWH02_04210 [Oscillospiraceae bacterium]|nr:hypothetical protein [Oscillospiraceae bacterium]